MKTLLILITVLLVLAGGVYAGWAFWYKPMQDRIPVAAIELKGVRLGDDIEDVQFAFGALLKHATVGDYEVYQYPLPASAEGDAGAGAGAGATPAAGAAGDAAAGGGASPVAAPGTTDGGRKPLRIFTHDKVITGLNYRCTAASDPTAIDQVHCGQAVKDLVIAYAGLDLRQYCTADDPLLRFIDLPRLGKSFFMQANHVAELWIRKVDEAPQFLDGDRWKACGHKHPSAL